MSAKALRPRPKVITEDFIEAVCQRLRDNKPVNRRLPVWGKVHIDRQLPFLILYRRPMVGNDESADRLLVGEASYLLGSGDRRLRADVSDLVFRVGRTMAEAFGAFLVLELWTDPEDGLATRMEAVPAPSFRVVHSGAAELSHTVEAFEEALRGVRVRRRAATVESVTRTLIAPYGSRPIVNSSQAAAANIYLLGLEIVPIFRDPDGNVFPLVLRDLHRGLAKALKKGMFRFARSRTTHQPAHYHALGRRALVKAVWEVDRRLAAISSRFDFLLLVTPVNAREAWNTFQRGHFEKPPRFLYRPLPVAPGLEKRELYAIPLESIDDPELSWLFRQKQYELDRQLTALLDRDTSRFRYVSLQASGPPGDELIDLARTLLDKIPSRSRETRGGEAVDAHAFQVRAAKELDDFRKTLPEISSRVEIRSDISGLIVSRGNLLIPADLSVPSSRLEALIQHEVGTHVLTYLNGKAQPFHQLYAGLAGYDELQEGIAVLSEYLVGGLSAPRLRLLAARVLAVHRMVEGATFTETFRELDREYDFSRQTAFTVTMRVFRAGGLTKDAGYLRGVVRLIRYLQGGGNFEPLLIGKISAEHVPVVQELLRRRVLLEPPLRPRYLADPVAEARLQRIKQQGTVVDLIEKRRW